MASSKRNDIFDEFNDVKAQIKEAKQNNQEVVSSPSREPVPSEPTKPAELPEKPTEIPRTEFKASKEVQDEKPGVVHLSELKAIKKKEKKGTSIIFETQILKEVDRYCDELDMGRSEFVNILLKNSLIMLKN